MRTITVYTENTLTAAQKDTLTALATMPVNEGREKRKSELLADLVATKTTAFIADGPEFISVDDGAPEKTTFIKNVDELISNEKEAYPVVLKTGNKITFEPGDVYFIHLNRDYEEFTYKAYSPVEVNQYLAEEFCIGLDDYELTEDDVLEGSEEFFSAIRLARDDGRWKGATVLGFDPTTHEVSTYFQ